MSQGPQRFHKTELGRLIEVAKDKLGDAYNIVIQKDGTMVLQAGKKEQSPPCAPEPPTVELASNEWRAA
jgi:hypothetical protein